MHVFHPIHANGLLTHCTYYFCYRYDRTVWRERSIFIPECGVTVTPPYGAENCTGTAGNGLDRVQKILRQQEEALRTKPA